MWWIIDKIINFMLYFFWFIAGLGAALIATAYLASMLLFMYYIFLFITTMISNILI